MCVLLALFVFCACATSATLSSAVIGEHVNACSVDEFECSNGACVGMMARCDGVSDCMDGGDEMGCGIGSSGSLLFGDPTLYRSRRQSGCRKNEWQCRDGSCISFDGKCDGVVDCPDASDESFPLCRTTQCQPNLFRCTYGACVDGTAPCNGVKECADNSDELLPRCRNETNVERGKFKCLDGSFIPSTSYCDGTPDCVDGSDETVRACAAITCPYYLFQCEYGACVDKGADCNGIRECADGSDESDELCNRILPGTATGGGTATTSTTAATVTKPSTSGSCVLPPYPEHGTYTVSNAPNAVPGQVFESLQLKVSCHRDYGVDGDSSVFCLQGRWLAEIPKCERFCKINNHPSVHYNCLVSGSIEGQRPCNSYEPNGTVVRPECNAPNYYSTYSLPFMRCIDGMWDNVVTCLPECGKITPEGEVLVLGGRSAKKGELPWQAAIYVKTTKPYIQICGGSLISYSLVISAAHCFWSDSKKLLPAANYAVAVGKLYRPWENDRDVYAQKSDVKDIHVPSRFRGGATNFQDDIAIMVMVTAFEYQTFVRPVCLSFDVNFERRQLQPGKTGKVAGWGLTTENNDTGSPVLKVTELPYVDIEVCYDVMPADFKEYITSDKICAGYINNGTALCKGDSGGGLTFPVSDLGIERYYLRGVVSTAPKNENSCNANTPTTFTRIMNHENFIKMYL